MTWRSSSWWAAGITAAFVVAGPCRAHAEPWSEDEGFALPVRRTAGDTGIELSAEHRVQGVHLASLDLAGESATWVEQRLRAELAVDHDETVRLVLGIDALDGVVFGASDGGALAPQTPGLERLGVVYRGAGDRTAPTSYTLGLVEGDAAVIRRAYGEVYTPVGLLRIGRQPTSSGTTLLYADGDGRANRFGVAGSGDHVDRIALTTRPLQGFDADSQRDERGLSITTHYDLLRQGATRLGEGALQRAGAELRYLAPRPTLEQHYDVRLRGSAAWSAETHTYVEVLGTVLEASVYELAVGLELDYVTGETREAALALAPLAAAAASSQRIAQLGARFVARWDEPTWSAYLEVDYASGDADAALDSRLTRFTFAPDANVGLLLFDHVLAHAADRAAAAAVAARDAVALPFEPVSAGAASNAALVDQVATRGAFTNAVAFFPQVDVRPRRDLLVRGGVLLAWTADGLIDPAASLRARALGAEEDVSYHGGAPGFLYGTEVDLRVAWRYRDHFLVDLEGAVLAPGDALESATGKAETAGLALGRTTFLF